MQHILVSRQSTFCTGWQTGHVQQYYFCQLEERDQSEKTSSCSIIRNIIRESMTLLIYENFYEILIFSRANEEIEIYNISLNFLNSNNEQISSTDLLQIYLEDELKARYQCYMGHTQWFLLQRMILSI